MKAIVKEEKVAIDLAQTVDRAEIKIEKISDPVERHHRLRYQLVEVMIYLGWPLLLGCIFFFCFGIVSSVVATVVAFLWPYLKGAYGNLRAKKDKGDPRLKIRSLFWFDGILFWGSPFLREIRQYSALGRSLDVIYNFFGRFGMRPMKFLDDSWANVSPFNSVNRVIKLWTDFWGNMPIAQDVRTRLDVVAEEYRKEIELLAFTEPGRIINILEVAGGTLQAVIMGISRALKDGANFRYQIFSIEPDGEFSKTRALQLVKEFGLDECCFKFITSRISVQNPARAVRRLLADDGSPVTFDLVVCIGLGDYYYSFKRITSLLQNLDMGRKIIVANISDNVCERGYLHYLIQWPKMRYRSLDEWISILRYVWPDRKIKIVQTPHKIFNIAIVGQTDL